MSTRFLSKSLVENNLPKNFILQANKFPDDETYPLGWPRLAAFQNQSHSCAVYRRFGLLFCRSLLQLQGELTFLEKKLHKLDTDDNADINMHYRLRSSDDEESWDPAQRNILKEIQEKLSIYGETLRTGVAFEGKKRFAELMSAGDLLDKDARLRQLGPAPARNHQNVYNWMNYHKPLEKGHDEFIFRKEDFIAPVKDSQQSNNIVNFIESLISRYPEGPLKVRVPAKHQKNNLMFSILLRWMI
jgi:hypothetical protein